MLIICSVYYYLIYSLLTAANVVTSSAEKTNFDIFIFIIQCQELQFLLGSTILFND